MERIKFLTDSACDIPMEDAQRLGIEVMPIPITVDGQGYYERRDFTPQQFYQMQLDAKEVPSTSHITAVEFCRAYVQAYREGYTHVIHVTICSEGSNMFTAANLAKEMVMEKYPELEGKLDIHVIDSKIYTIAYGYPLMQAAQMARDGEYADDIVDYLTDFFDRVEVYFSVFTLEFVKKSGRVKSAAAFVGEMLGLRPILNITEGRSEIIDKVRGDKLVVPRLARVMKERPLPERTPYIVIRGMDPAPADELAALLTKQQGYPPEMIVNAGASIAINAGPKLVGLCFVGQKRTR